MFELYFLGTSASAPSIHRGLSAMVIKHSEFRYLVDCGEGTQRQILKSGLGFKRLNRILITHGHLDHILGLGGLLSTLMRWETISEIEIVGGRNALNRIEDLIFGVVLRGITPPINLMFKEADEGIIYQHEPFSVSAFPVTHRGADCFGYLFSEIPKRAFLVKKAEALAIPPGPWRKELVNGNQVSLPDGRVIQPDQVLGPEKRGTRVMVVGDTRRTDNLVEVAQGVDALVIEATYLHAERDMAQQFGHLTARQAAELASMAGAGKLILNHISRRYRERDVIKEARAIFPESVVARDFDVFQVKKGKQTRRVNNVGIS
jgi:ribonuclease Z